MRGTLLQQIFIGDDNEGDFGGCCSKLHTQIGAYACRFTRGNDQWCRKRNGIHWLFFLFETIFDERAVAQLAQPVLELFIRLECADRDACLLALLLLADIGIAPLQHLDQMPAELGLHHSHLPGLQFVHRLFKFRHGLPRGKPVQITALLRAAIL